MPSTFDQSTTGTLRDGRVHLDGRVDWPEGTVVEISRVVTPIDLGAIDGPVIVVGFGLAGRCVADLLDSSNVPFSIIERNPVTVETQTALGRTIIEGDAEDADTLISAGLHGASILALTIPDEEAVLAATSLARRLSPTIHIIARTNYSSQGMKASQVGANDVIKAEQAVALQFYEKLRRRLRAMPEPTPP